MSDYINFSNLVHYYTNLNEINKTNDEEPLLLVVYGMTHPAGIQKIRELWGRFDTTKKAFGRDETKSIRINPEFLGGAITLFKLNLADGSKSTLLGDISITNPMGIYFHELTDELFVGVADGVVSLKHGGIERRISNNLFNTVHAIKKSPNGIYVTCTGTDSIVEIDPVESKKTIWDWVATENGFSTDRFGNNRIIDRNTDYQSLDVGGTRSHTTHINGVESFGEDYVLATLFHQDKIIKIAKHNFSWETIYSDLTNPHGINKITEGYIVSDTRGSKVVLFDDYLNPVNEIKGDFDWIQDSIQFQNHFIVGNDNHGKLDIFNDKLQYVTSVQWNKDVRKISTLLKISGKQAKSIFA